jgi:hypothetical protein
VASSHNTATAFADRDDDELPARRGGTVHFTHVSDAEWGKNRMVPSFAPGARGTARVIMTLDEEGPAKPVPSDPDDAETVDLAIVD